MKNCEGTTGNHNMFLESQGRSFQVIEAPRGLPFWGRRTSSQAQAWDFRKNWNYAIFMENPHNIFLNNLGDYGT